MRKVQMEHLKTIVALLEQDKTYQEIADQMEISVSSIRWWIKRMKAAHVKLNITRGRRPLDLNELEHE